MKKYYTTIVVAMGGYEVEIVVKRVRLADKKVNLLQPKSGDFIFDLDIKDKIRNKFFSGTFQYDILDIGNDVDSLLYCLISENIKPILTKIMVSILTNCFNFQFFDQVYEKNKSGQELTKKDIKKISNNIIDEMIIDFSLDEVVFKSAYAPFSAVSYHVLCKMYAVDYKDSD